MISILSEYGTEFPQELQSELRANIIFPDEKKKSATIECANVPIDKSFNPPTNTCLLLSRKCSLNSLCRVVEQSTVFLDPIKPNMDLLVYFKFHHSYLFSTHMQHAIPDGAKNEITPEQVQVAVDNTKALLVKVLKGTATYGEIIAENQFKLELFNVEEEFSNLLNCQSLREYGAAGLTGIKSLLKLIQFAKPILILKQVCEQYGLECCLNDPDFKEISELAQILQDGKERANISTDDAKCKWEMVHKALCLKEDASPKCLELFSKVADSADFYHFLKEKELVGTLGYAQFHHKIEVITRHQELDEYQQMVLNHLFAAFTFIAPIMDPSHDSLHSLMSAVTALNLPEELSQLETVRKNMHLIQFWFSSSEDTPENVSSELKGILESGSYHIETTNTTSTRSRLQLVIEYKLSFVSTPHETSLEQPTGKTQDQARRQEVMKFHKRTLTTEQIDDFVHRLELLKGRDQNVEDFLCLNEVRFEHYCSLCISNYLCYLYVQVAYKLLEVFGNLQALGHPEVSQKHFTYTLQCSALLSVIKKEV